MDRKAFFSALRPHVNLTTQNVAGTDRVLTYGEARGTPLHHFAYILATAWWETAQTMHPVVEAYWLSEDWRRRNLRYYPWHGRGLIQTTWEANYRKMGDVIGVDLIADPDKLLQWDCALPALFVGMERGLYTGRDLDDYIDLIDEDDAEDLREFTNARRIVNGSDKQVTIGKLALRFEAALKAAGYDQDADEKPAPVPPKPKPDVPAPEPENVRPSHPITWQETAAILIGAGAVIAIVVVAMTLL